MPTIDDLKEQVAAYTPIFLFDCVLASGATERWSTHAVTFGGNAYGARLLKHNLLEVDASSDTAKITVTLANAGLAFLADRKGDGISWGAGHDPIPVLRFGGGCAGFVRRSGYFPRNW